MNGFAVLGCGSPWAEQKCSDLPSKVWHGLFSVISRQASPLRPTRPAIFNTFSMHFHSKTDRKANCEVRLYVGPGHLMRLKFQRGSPRNATCLPATWQVGEDEKELLSRAFETERSLRGFASGPIALRALSSSPAAAGPAEQPHLKS